MTKKIPVALCCLALALPLTACSSKSSTEPASSGVAQLGPKAPLDEVIATNLVKAKDLAGGDAQLLTLDISLSHDGIISMFGRVAKGAVSEDFTSMDTFNSNSFEPRTSVDKGTSHPATATLPIAQLDAKKLAEQLTAARDSCPGGTADTRLAISAQLQHKRSEQVVCIVKGEAGKQTYKPVTTTLMDEPAAPLDVSSIAGIQKGVARAASLLGSQRVTTVTTSHQPLTDDLRVTGVVKGEKALDGSRCDEVSVALVDPARTSTQFTGSLAPRCQIMGEVPTGVTPAQITDTEVFTKAVSMAKADLTTDEVRIIATGDKLLWNITRLVGTENKTLGSYTSTIR